MRSVSFAALLALLLLESAPTQDFGDLQSLKNHSSGGIFPSLTTSMLPNLGSGSSDFSSALQDQAGMFETVNESLYVVGPGDFMLVGMGNKVSLLPISPEGYIVIENVGLISVANKTLLEAKKIIVSAVTKVYKGDRIFSTLGKFKKIQVSIVGAVANPGIYLMGATARLSEAIILAGGATPTANKKVVVLDRRGNSKNYDLDLYFRGSDMAQNPYLSAGDQIQAEEIDFVSATVQIRENDQVVTVQLKEGASAFDLATTYYRTRKPRNWDLIRVYEEGAAFKGITKKEAATYFPKANAVLELHSYKALVFVSGAVGRPTSYDFNVNFNALDYVTAAGILPMSGDISRLEVVNGEGKTRTVDSSKEKIMPGDHILVPQSGESRMREWVGVLASVASIVSSIVLAVVTLESRK